MNILINSYGHKPSGWLVPGKGHFPDGGDKVEGTFVVGPMARNVADLEAVLNVISKQNASKLRPVKVYTTYQSPVHCYIVQYV